MLCPRCGKEVTKAGGFCGFCGSALSPANSPSDESPTSAGYVAPLLTPKQRARRSGQATASLIIGLFPFAFIPGLGVLAYLFNVDFLGISLFLSIMYLPLISGLLAVIFGHQARGLIRRRKGQLRGGRVATAGLILGYLLLLGWIAMPKTFDWNDPASWDASAVISLRAINTAAKAYSTAYKRGFPRHSRPWGHRKLNSCFSVPRRAKKRQD